MILERVALCPINYILNTVPAGSTVADTYRQAASILNVVEFSITSPMRYHFSPKSMLKTAGLCPQATGQPRPQPPVTSPGMSSLFGQTMLRLREPLRIPKDGAIQWDLSAMSPWVLPGSDTPFSQSLTPLSAWMLYQEVGGLFSGSARSFNAQLPVMAQTAFPNFDQSMEECWPYPPDYFGTIAFGDASASNMFWDPRAAFSARNFEQQNATRAGSTTITQLRTMIDQRAYDDDLAGAINTNTWEQVQSTPVSTRIGTRITTRNCGSQTWWWRPGAPLALVFDAITPAAVYEFDRPITLGPGDTLEVQMQVPGQGPASERPFYHVGISFNGFSAIEG